MHLLIFNYTIVVLNVGSRWKSSEFVALNFLVWSSPANITLFNVNKSRTGKSCEVCSKSNIKTPE